MLDQLKEAQTNLVLQRAQAKDIVEAAERQLGIINGQIQVLEAKAKAEAEESNQDSE